MIYNYYMRICSKCLISKSDKNYYVKDRANGRLHTQCKDCYKIYRQSYYPKHYQDNKLHYRLRAKSYRAKLREEYRLNMLEFLKNKSCVICAESDIRTLEFDHLPDYEKSFNISQAVRLGYKWPDVEEEMKKCRILCANCHKKHTSFQAAWYKEIS